VTPIERPIVPTDSKPVDPIVAVIRSPSARPSSI